MFDQTLVHGDETSYPEGRHSLWLWVFTNATSALFLIGERTKEMFVNLLQSCPTPFLGWLMSDGYRVYRDSPWRLRCWEHLIRKARGLSEGYWVEPREAVR